MSNPFFSIVMPAYNCEASIVSSIQALQKQSFSDFECIIINDGSTDGTEETIQKMIEPDGRFQLFTTVNAGPGAARNHGIDKASGQYLLFVDADDVLPRQALEDRASLLQDGSYDLIVGSYVTDTLQNGAVVEEEVTRAEDQIFTTHQDFLDHLYELMDQQLMYVLWNKIYRLDLVKAHHISFPSYRSCEDRLFNLNYYQYVNHCLISSRILYHYSFDPNHSLTNQFIENKFETYEVFYQTAVSMVPKDKPGFAALYLKGVMASIVQIHSESCPYIYRDKRAYISTILDHDTVKEASQCSLTDTMVKKVMKVLFRLRSVTLLYFASWVVYRLTHASPEVVEKLKRQF